MLADLIAGRGHNWTPATAITAIHAITGPGHQGQNSESSGNSGSKLQFRKTPPFSAPELADYCTAMSVQLLRDDSEFLLRLLPRQPQARLSVMDNYLARWKEAACEEAIEHKQQNAGRYAANTWLRQHSSRAQ